MEIIFAPKIRRSSLSYLDGLIEHHFNDFKILFSEANPINTIYHFSRYTQCIERTGSLRRFANLNLRFFPNG